MIATKHEDRNLPLRSGYLEGKLVEILLDTGSQVSIIKPGLVDSSKLTGETSRVCCVHGDEKTYPLALVTVELEGWERVLEVALVPDVPVDVILGIGDSHPLDKLESNPSPARTTEARSLAVVTRARARHQERTTKGEAGTEEVNAGTAVLPTTGEVLHATPQQIKEWQQTDPSLNRVRELARDEDDDCSQGAAFFYRNGLLYRRWEPKTPSSTARRSEQLVLPQQCRQLAWPSAWPMMSRQQDTLALIRPRVGF